MQTGERTTEDKRVQNSNIRPKGTYCAALWCNNNFGSNPSLSLFRIPREKQRAAQWLENAGREDLLERGPKAWHIKYLCEQHFTDRMFMNENRKKLVWNAVPTIFPQPPNMLKKNLVATSGTKDTSSQAPLQVNKVLRKILPKPTSLTPEEVPTMGITASATCTDEDMEDMATLCAATAIPENKNSQLLNETVNNISLVESTETNEEDSFLSDLSDVKDASFEPYSFHFDFKCEESSEKAFPCSSCGEMFLFKNSLIAHEAKYHPESYSVTEHVREKEFMEDEYDRQLKLKPESSW